MYHHAVENESSKKILEKLYFRLGTILFLVFMLNMWHMPSYYSVWPKAFREVLISG